MANLFREALEGRDLSHQLKNSIYSLYIKSKINLLQKQLVDIVAKSNTDFKKILNRTAMFIAQEIIPLKKVYAAYVGSVTFPCPCERFVGVRIPSIFQKSIKLDETATMLPS